MSFATESGHWYAKDGTPTYEVENKSKGGMRPTRITDARKLNLVPSVTTILKVADKPALNRWKVTQVAMAAVTLPPIDGESADDFLKRVYQDAEQQSRDARDRGTHLHGSLEKYFAGENPLREHKEICERVAGELFNAGIRGPWSVEKSFASSLGYGGKVDLHSPTCVVDFKRKDKPFDGSKLAYDEHAMQLVAYRNGLGLPHDAQCANVFIDSTGDVAVHVWGSDDLDRAWGMFSALNLYWQIANNYKVK